MFTFNPGKLLSFDEVATETSKFDSPFTRLQLLYTNYKVRWYLQRENKLYQEMLQKTINYAIKNLDKDDELRVELRKFMVEHKANIKLFKDITGVSKEKNVA